MKRILLTALIAVVLFSFLNAEIYVKSESRRGAFEMMGKKQPAKEEFSEQWIGDNKMAHNWEGQTIVIDGDKKVVYFIYHNTKTYVEAPLPLDLKKFMSTQMLATMSMMKITANVTPGNETKKIGDWNCKSFNLDINMGMMTMNSTIWATEDVPFDWKSYVDKMYPTLLQAIFARNMTEETSNQYKKIKGFEVAQSITTSFMGQQVKTDKRVVEIAEKPAPPGTFTVPQGYEKQDQLTMPKWGR